MIKEKGKKYKKKRGRERAGSNTQGTSFGWHLGEKGTSHICTPCRVPQGHHPNEEGTELSGWEGIMPGSCHSSAQPGISGSDSYNGQQQLGVFYSPRIFLFDGSAGTDCGFRGYAKQAVCIRG